MKTPGWTAARLSHLAPPWKTITLFTPLCGHLSAISATSPTKVKKTWISISLFTLNPKSHLLRATFVTRDLVFRLLLTVHLRRHSGERPFARSFCEKRLLTHAVLKSPVPIHTSKRQYACTFLRQDIHTVILAHCAPQDAHERETLPVQHMWNVLLQLRCPAGAFTDPHRGAALSVRFLW